MVGKNCVAIASDKRLGAQALMVSNEFPKAFQISDKLYLGLTGLATDVQTVYINFSLNSGLGIIMHRYELMKFKTNLYKLREERAISPSAFAHLVSSTLYGKRYSPIYVYSSSRLIMIDSGHTLPSP